VDELARDDNFITFSGEHFSRTSHATGQQQRGKNSAAEQRKRTLKKNHVSFLKLEKKHPLIGGWLALEVKKTQSKIAATKNILEKQFRFGLFGSGPPLIFFGSALHQSLFFQGQTMQAVFGNFFQDRIHFQIGLPIGRKIGSFFWLKEFRTSPRKKQRTFPQKNKQQNRAGRNRAPKFWTHGIEPSLVLETFDSAATVGSNKNFVHQNSRLTSTVCHSFFTPALAQNGGRDIH